MFEKEKAAFEKWKAKPYNNDEIEFSKIYEFEPLMKTNSFFGGYHSRDGEISELVEALRKARRVLTPLREVHPGHRAYEFSFRGVVRHDALLNEIDTLLTKYQEGHHEEARS